VCLFVRAWCVEVVVVLLLCCVAVPFKMFLITLLRRSSGRQFRDVVFISSSSCGKKLSFPT
jgi:hypothetical protein